VRLTISLVNCSLESDMATRVVLDHSGDSRHVFDRVNAEAILRAETFFNELTAKELYGGGTDGGPRGHTTRKFRPAYGRDAVQPAPGRRLLERTLANRRHPLRYGLQTLAITKLYGACCEEKTSHARSWRLLRSWLSPEQNVQLARKGYFEVVGSDTRKRYRIGRGTSANVNEVDSRGRLGGGWCFVPVGGLAEGDVMLSQKIALETNEPTALAVANSFPAPTSFHTSRSRLWISWMEPCLISVAVAKWCFRGGFS
jgi:hypothetical protein